MVPAKYNIRKRKQTITMFRGINQSINTSMSKVSTNNSSLFMEFQDTRNVTNEDYPAIRTRKKRLYSGKANVMYGNSIISNILCCEYGVIRVENNGYLYIGDEGVYELFTKTDNSARRTLTWFGNSIVVMPDKLILTPEYTEDGFVFNTEHIENIYEGECASGRLYNDLPSILKIPYNTSIEPRNVYIQNFGVEINKTENQKNNGGEHAAFQEFFNNLELGDVIEDTHTDPSTLYMVTEIKSGDEYSEYFNNRVLTLTILYKTYTKIQCAGIGEGFNADDWVRISGIENYNNLNSSFKIIECDADYIVINYELEHSIKYEGVVKVERVMPCDMDYLICCDNRLWGCSSENNRIYASRLGDGTNWEAYGDGISTDSYWVDISSEGDFTGITVSSNSIYFFKENCIHRIYGTKPKNFSLTTYKDMGIQKGSENSVVWIKDRLFYLSPVGVCVYSPGGEPTLISKDAFGHNKYVQGVGGKHGSKYYISAINQSSEESELYVYDTDNGLWLKEDSERFLSCASYNNILYFENKFGYIGCIDGSEGNLLQKSFEAYSVNLPQNHIGEKVNSFGDLEIEGVETVLGDIDGDGFITNNDSIMLREIVASVDTYDRNGDGKITEADVSILLDAGETELVRQLIAADVSRLGVVDINDATLIDKWLDKPELFGEKDLEFLIESGDLYDTDTEKKYIQRLDICYDIAPGGRVFIEVSKNYGPWEEVMRLGSTRKGLKDIPVFPGRCDHFRIRFRGVGEFILYALTITTEGGSATDGRF